jgi:anti-sigma28 factor (negative regulator of flagellin synthesis)
MCALNFFPFFRRKKIMPTSKKTSTKKAAKKSTKKAAVAGSATLKFPIDAAKVEAIKRCLAKGTLTVTVSRADLGRARMGDPYKYD